MIPGISSRRRFSDLSEQEILALAISAEEDDGRIYASYAEMLRADFPQSAKLFEEMAAEDGSPFGGAGPIVGMVIALGMAAGGFVLIKGLSD